MRWLRNPFAGFKKLRFVKLLGTCNLCIFRFQRVGSPQLPNLSDRKGVGFAFNCDDERSIFFVRDSVGVRQWAEFSDSLQNRGSTIQNRCGNFLGSPPLPLRGASDAGAIVGTADLSGPSGSQSHHAFLWRNGVTTDLGTLGATSHAEGINSEGQIVGRSKPTPDRPVQHAFLWENGGPMVDLNTLIPANPPLLLEEGGNINDRGEIGGRGVPLGCDDVDACGHAFLLIPCDSDANCDNKGQIVTPTAIPHPTNVKSSFSPKTSPHFLNTWPAPA